ncbi:hypothetical protein R3I79_003507 [Escherichia coli]|nr:hypothetical protein [Escherichia coli]
MNLNFKYILPLLSSFIISGCDSDGISKVKSFVYYDIDDSMTVGKAFATRSDCINGTWSEKEDDRGRAIVTYTCNISEVGLRIINSAIIKEPENRAEYHIEQNNNQIKSTNESLERYKQKTSLVEKTKELVIENIRKLNSAFNEDPIIHSKLTITPYLDNMLKLKDYNDNALNEICGGYIYTQYANTYSWRDVSEDYVKESCKKYIYQIYQSFKENASPLITKNFPSFYEVVPSYCENADECIERTKSYFDEYFFNIHTKIKNSAPQTISDLENKNIEIGKKLNECRKTLNVSGVKLTYYWFVTDTGGVDYLDGLLTYNFQGENRVKNYHKQLLQYAYINYDKNQIPQDFVTSIKNVLFYKIKSCTEF